jgi:midasin
VAFNMSQQTDAGDLLGGYRPVEPGAAMAPLVGRFADLVRATWTK